jgi:CheY-like chemotaxis protein
MGTGPTLAGIRILVVDDEPDTLELECLVLEGQGAEVLCTDSAARALAAIPVFRPHVLISDIAMPGMDGCNFIAAVRERSNEEGGSVPALAVSAHASGDNRGRALRAGFDRFLAKPMDPAKLIETTVDLVAKGGGAAPRSSSSTGSGT